MTDLEMRVRELETWAAEHDGKNNAKWEEQDRDNIRCNQERAELKNHTEQNFGLVFRELTSLKTKVAAFAAIASLTGAGAATEHTYSVVCGPFDGLDERQDRSIGKRTGEAVAAGGSGLAGQPTRPHEWAKHLREVVRRGQQRGGHLRRPHDAAVSLQQPERSQREVGASRNR